MAPLDDDDVEKIAEAVMKRHASGEIPANGGSTRQPSQPPMKVQQPEQTEQTEAPEKKSWWDTFRVPLAAAAGAILAVGGALLTVGISWGGAQQEIAAVKAEQAAIKTEVAAKADAAVAARAEDRLRTVEQASAAYTAGNTSDHKAIVKELGETKVEVREVRAAQVEQDKKLDRILSKLKNL